MYHKNILIFFLDKIFNKKYLFPKIKFIFYMTKYNEF